MRRRLAGALAGLGMLMVLAPTGAMADAGDVILAGSQSQVDYHAEAAPAKPADGGATIIGGNIQITSDRGARGGLAGPCDPDPRFGTHPRPDDDGCAWDEPVGAGQDLISFGRHIAAQDATPDTSGSTGSGAGGSGDLSGDTDTSPDGAFVPVTTPTRESFNGRGGLDQSGALFMESRPVLDDEDLNFRITGAAIFNYLAPQGNADNRWRRLCGEGVVSQLSDNAPITGPFAAGDTVPFVIQVWDADWKDPSDLDGGNQDYFIVDVLPQGTSFDVRSCRAVEPPDDPPGNPPDGPQPPAPPAPPAAPNPAPVQATRAASAVKGITVRRGTARIAGIRGCPISRPVTLRVQGRQIRRVTFLVDGRRVATVTRADAAGRYLARVDPGRLRTGVHRVRVRVQFRSGAGPARTLTMSFRTCARPVQAVQPHFTG